MLSRLFTEFGKFVSNKCYSRVFFQFSFCVFLIILTLPRLGFAAEGVVKVVVILQGALVYKEADFDAKIIGQAKRGDVFDASPKKKGYFYRIRVKPGVIGYISDVDVRITKAKKENIEVAKTKAEVKEDLTPKKPFLSRRYRGIAFEMMNYTESTLGGNRTAQVPFLGIKWSGNNTMFSGETYTDANILAAFSAPKYYETYTGNGASGWIVNLNFLFMNSQQQGRNHFTFFGMGPMFKYSHFDATLTNPTTSKNNNYALDDMAVGAVFSLGLAFDIGKCALRSEVKYYLESKQYASFGLSLQMDF
ncbi:MAG: SH3 domain-containing protein [Bdellovibrionota bacterium]